MENKFIDTPFDFNKVPQLDLEAVKAGMEQGNRYLEFQFKTIEAVRRRCTMILGWLFAVIVGTAGTMVYSLFSGAPNMPVSVLLVVFGHSFYVFISFGKDSHLMGMP